MKHKPPIKCFRGFTLSELLITLAILGLIATFTIPKVLTGTSNKICKVKAKETMGTLAQLVEKYSADNDITNTTTFEQLVTSMNYAQKITTSLDFDDTPGNPSMNCSDANITCYKLHNGALLWTQGWQSGTFSAEENGVKLTFLGLDPDGQYNGTKSLYFVLYETGNIRTAEQTTILSELDPDWWRGS